MSFRVESVLDLQPALGAWFLTGPTASGKTAIGIEVARRIGAEILSLDSMAIYRGMDIGTAKPAREQREAVPHHLVDIAEPEDEFSTFSYVEAARAALQDICTRGKQVLFVGGTPLYLKALLRGLFIGPGADWSFRRQLEEEVRTVGSGALHERLALVDPLAASRLHPNDTRRMIRALEVYRLTGKPISHWQVQFDDSHAPDRCRVFVIQWPREMLHQRIDARVEWMFANGLVDEVRRLTSGGRRLGRTASQAVGYREVLEHLAGRWTLAEARREVEVRTRRFARRQGTWFRSLSECRAVPLTADTTVPEIVESILRMGRGGPDAEADKRLD